MQSPVLDNYAPGLWADPLYQIQRLSPGVAVLICVLLLALGAWLFRRGLPFRRAARAIERTPMTQAEPAAEAAAAAQAREEPRTLLRLKLRFWQWAGPGILSALCGLWLLKQNALMYAGYQAFLGALLAQPWQPAPLPP